MADDADRGSAGLPTAANSPRPESGRSDSPAFPGADADSAGSQASTSSMVAGRTIVCFASGYDLPPTSKHHVMHVLSERNVVLWVNYHASRAPTASASDLAYMAAKLKQVVRGIETPRRNVYVLTPLVLPLPGSRWAKRINRTMLLFQVRRALKRVKAGRVQVWSFTPDISHLLGHFGEEKVLYYCVDDFAEFTGYDRQQVLRDEEELCRRADLVVTTSMALQQSKQHLNPNTILVPHGVDYDHFAKARSNDLPAPPDIAGIGRPRLGFFGLIRDWVDLDLLAAVARRRPDWHIVMIGDSAIDLAPYRELPNMHFLGRKAYAELPAYCRHLDVGLIPFKINSLTLAVNPIKLREYLAAGLPVVSTPLPEVKTCESLVRIGEGADDFTTAIAAALEDEQSRQERGQTMAEEVWPQKVARITNALAASDSGDRAIQ